VKKVYLGIVEAHCGVSNVPPEIAQRMLVWSTFTWELWRLTIES
jgi:hypothetical protein